VAIELRYDEGTVRLLPADGSEADLAALPGVVRDERAGGYRAPGGRYAAVLAALDERGLEYEDRVLDLAPVPDLVTDYELREYQATALDAWRDADRRGCLELPTGSGKTVVAIAAIAARSVPTLVVVPTIDLMEQWRGELATEFGDQVGEIGQYGGGEQRTAPLTVSTYASAYRKVESIGDRFAFAVFDEVHHLGGEGYRDAARLLPAPDRMGLTATFERPDGAHEAIADLVGPLVHALSPDDLAGEHLAPYDVKRLRVALTDDERERYEDNQETFTDYLARSDITMQSGRDYRKLVMRSGTDPAAREALLAKQRAREIMLGSERKLAVLGDLLERHREDRIIVFTAHNDVAYEVADRYLVPVITHRTGTDERTEILERFRDGTYSRIVSSNVLDEGVDVPDANVAVVLSGSGSEREFTQRLGRILRPKADGGRAILYEVVSEETAEERVARRRR